MTEREFWKALEFRVSREIGRFRDKRLRFLWCDGLTPDDQQTDDNIIIGSALISEDCGRTFEQYRFRLWRPHHLPDDHLDWEAALPADSEHDWLTVDRDEKLIEIRRGLAKA